VLTLPAAMASLTVKDCGVVRNEEVGPNGPLPERWTWRCRGSCLSGCSYLVGELVRRIGAASNQRLVEGDSRVPHGEHRPLQAAGDQDRGDLGRVYRSDDVRADLPATPVSVKVVPVFVTVG